MNLPSYQFVAQISVALDEIAHSAPGSLNRYQGLLLQDWIFRFTTRLLVGIEHWQVRPE